MPTGEFLFVPNTTLQEVQAGLTTKLYVLFGGIDVEAFNPQHDISINGDEFSPETRQSVYSGGLYKATINVTDNSLSSGVDTITVNGVVYTFHSSSGTGAQIVIGAAASDTETNIAAELDAVTGLDASVVSGVVEITSESPITVATSIGAKITVAVANTPATFPVTIDGDTFIEGTGNVKILPITVNSKADNVYIVAYTPASATKTTTAANVKVVFGHALAGTDPGALGLVFSQNLASRAQISTALQKAFGSTLNDAVTLTGTDSNIITFKAVGTDAEFTGYQGNFLYAFFGVTATEPDLGDLISFGKNENPIIAGRGPMSPVGSTINYKRAAAPTVTNIPQDSARTDLGSVLTNIGDNISATLNQVHNATLQALVSGAAAIAYGSKYSYVMQNGNLGTVAIMAVTKNQKGKFHIDFVPKAKFTGGLQKDLSKASTAGLPFTAVAEAADNAAATGFSAIFRQSAQQ